MEKLYRQEFVLHLNVHLNPVMAHNSNKEHWQREGCPTNGIWRMKIFSRSFRILSTAMQP